MEQSAEAPQRFYVFYFDDRLEGEHTHQIVLDNQVPHRLQKFQESAYAGAMSIGRGWGKIYIPQGALEEFMELTGNRFAPEPELHVDNDLNFPNWLVRWFNRFKSSRA